MARTSGVSDKKLLEQAIAGCRDSFDVLVGRYYGSVYAHAQRILRNSDDASDATQTTFLKALKSIQEFQLDRPLKPWLLRIVSNVCIDIARSKHRHHDDLEKHSYSLESRSRPEDSANQSDLSQKIRAAIERLPERYRRIVLLRHYQHMDVEEIATALGAPEGTIKSWLFRARALLKQELSAVVESAPSLKPAA
ncbi:MAG: RNA polymerase sigma factor [Candidatus Nitrosotenuis sp.]